MTVKPQYDLTAVLDKFYVDHYRFDIGHEGEYAGRVCRVCQRWLEYGHDALCPVRELDQEIKGLYKEVARLSAELSAQSETVQQDWLSPVEAVGLRAEVERLKGMLFADKPQRMPDHTLSSFDLV